MSSKISMPRSLGASLQQYGQGGDIYSQVGSHVSGGHAVERGKVQALLDKMDFDMLHVFPGDRDLRGLRNKVRACLARGNPRSRWGTHFQKGDHVTWRTGSGMTYSGTYLRLAKASAFSRGYGRQAVIDLGDGDTMEVGLDDLVKAKSNPRAILFEVFDYKGVVQAKVKATTPEAAMRKFLKERGIKGALFTGNYGVRRVKNPKQRVKVGDYVMVRQLVGKPFHGFVVPKSVKKGQGGYRPKGHEVVVQSGSTIHVVPLSWVIAAKLPGRA